MAKLVIIAQVDDPARWTEKFKARKPFFREHGGQFGLSSPLGYGTGRDHEVVVIEEVSDAQKAYDSAFSEENKKAMAEDGVKVDTAKAFIVDQELAF
jgi:hypothetical protein